MKTYYNSQLHGWRNTWILMQYSSILWAQVWCHIINSICSLLFLWCFCSFHTAKQLNTLYFKWFKLISWSYDSAFFFFKKKKNQSLLSHTLQRSKLWVLRLPLCLHLINIDNCQIIFLLYWKLMCSTLELSNKYYIAISSRKS